MCGELANKRNFAKKSFADYLNKAGIEYIGMSEIGIQMLREYLKLTQKGSLWMYEKMFWDKYRQSWSYRSLAQEVNSALVCYEVT